MIASASGVLRYQESLKADNEVDGDWFDRYRKIISGRRRASEIRMRFRSFGIEVVVGFASRQLSLSLGNRQAG